MHWWICWQGQVSTFSYLSIDLLTLAQLAAGGFLCLEPIMANILNLSGLTVLEVKETASFCRMFGIRRKAR